MKAFIHASPAGAEARILAQWFSDFTELHRRGFLTDDSIVWANAEAPDGSFWALTDRSQYVYVHRTPVPGYVRLTAGRMRWARTNDATLEKVELDIDTRNISGDEPKNLTLIVKHRVPGQGVKVIDNSRLVPDIIDGTYTHKHLTVIDLAAYKPPSEPREASTFELNHAQYHGVNHMMSSMNAENAQLVRDHLDLYEFDITPEQIQGLVQYLDAIETYADGFADTIYYRLLHAARDASDLPDSTTHDAEAPSRDDTAGNDPNDPTADAS